MFVALVHRTSAGGYYKVNIVRNDVNGRLVAFETSEEAQKAAELAISDGELKSGAITVVDLSQESESVSESSRSYRVC